MPISPVISTLIFESEIPGRILGIELSPADKFSGKVKDLILQAQWDDDPVLAINAPVQDFFGYAFGIPSMKSLLTGSKNGVNYCYFPMPFDKKAKLSLFYDEIEGVEQAERDSD